MTAWTVRATMVGTRAAEVGTGVGGWRTLQAPELAARIRQVRRVNSLFFMVLSFWGRKKNSPQRHKEKKEKGHKEENYKER
jgi:hypothetical protein